MDTALQHRRSSEAGFTLIELLVVMIIIAILMGVAVPTFLAQKNSALKTQATANIKQVINAMEACAGNIMIGGYYDPGPPVMDCTDKTTLEGFEKSLVNLNIVTGQPTVTQTQIARSAQNQGFLVQRAINDSGQVIYFFENHMEDGNVVKGCAATAAGLMTTMGTPVPTSKTCQTGKW